MNTCRGRCARLGDGLGDVVGTEPDSPVAGEVMPLVDQGTVDRDLIDPARVIGSG